ncbi:MAG: WYL domain-containing protein [Acidimicrobiales bacterium]|nr:WYL domain-containing protein [Acidimicrobiales bacterium]
MRADRLIAVLMLMQRHGRITAARVAEELEISERTARRDLEALAVAGVPVYSVAGRGGGWELVGGARTDLSGLSAPEVRALFLAAGSVPGQPAEVTSALRKLLHAVPEPFQDEAAAAAEAVFVDRATWSGLEAATPPPVLSAVQDLVVRSVQADLHYLDRNDVETRRRVHPLGIVARGPLWYLVADTERGRRTFRVDRVLEVVALDERVVRPPGFDLEAAWAEITAAMPERVWSVRVVARVEGWTVRILHGLFRRRLLEVGPPGPDGRHRIEIGDAELLPIVGTVAGFGSAVDVVEPAEARSMLAAIGRGLVDHYG